MADTANHISYLHAWWNKEWGKHRGHLQIHKVPPPTAYLVPEKPSLIRRMACEIPNVGWEKAMKVEEYFVSVRRMFEASEEEWREIEGFGKVTAKNAWGSLHE